MRRGACGDTVPVVQSRLRHVHAAGLDECAVGHGIQGPHTGTQATITRAGDVLRAEGEEGGSDGEDSLEDYLELGENASEDEVGNGEPGGLAGEAEVRRGVEGEIQEGGGALLLIRASLPQADTHLDQHLEMEIDRDDGIGEVREEVQVLGTGREDREVGAQMANREGVKQRVRRERPQGEQEYGAAATARGAAEGSTNKRLRGNERGTDDIEGRQGGRAGASLGKS